MDRISDILGNPDLATGLAPFKGMIKQYQQTHQASPLDIAAALGHIAQGDTPLLIDAPSPRDRSKSRDEQREHRRAPERERARRPRSDDPATERPRRQTRRGPKAGMEVYRIEVGNQHGVKPANIVGAIANEADMQSQHIGHIEIFEDHSLVELPEGMPREIYRDLKKVWVAGQQLQISKPKSVSVTPKRSSGPKSEKPQKKPHRKGTQRKP
jgi:ATP-dependent RNA helicase DeaD